MNAISWESVLFTAFSAAAIGGALVVALDTKLFRAVMGLLLSLCGVAGLFGVLGSPLLAGLQVILYAGGVAVLFLFAVFVTPVEEGGRFRAGWFAGGVSVLVAVAVGGVLSATVAFRAWPTALAMRSISVAEVGRAFVGAYLLPFEAISVLLLAALVAAVVLIRKEIGR